MILAAIDIGSNAARLLICETSVYKDGTVDFTKLCLLRIPLRLGFEVFDNGAVTNEKKKKLTETLKAYKLLMNIYNVEAFKACATSAGAPIVCTDTTLTVVRKPMVTRFSSRPVRRACCSGAPRPLTALEPVDAWVTRLVPRPGSR